MLTKEQYMTIAKVVKIGTALVENKEAEAAAPIYWDAVRSTRVVIAKSLADYFEKNNPDFLRKEFLMACGL